MVVRVFVTLLEEVWLGQSPSYVPGDVRSMVSSLHPQFNNHSQQDAQELLLFLLNALHDDLKKVDTVSIRLATHHACGGVNYCVSVLQKGATRFSSHRGRKSSGGESTIVTRLFEGQLSYVTLCMRCDQQGQSNQVFTILSLPIPEDVYKCSLQVWVKLSSDKKCTLSSPCEIGRRAQYLHCNCS